MTLSRHVLSLSLALVLSASSTLFGSTELVSVAFDGVPANYASGEVSISGEGRYVAFRSAATDLVPDDTNALTDVFVRDTWAGETTRVSLSSAGEQINQGGADYPAISGDGQRVAFVSYAGNLVAGDTNEVPDVFVHDRLGGETIRASVATNGTQADQGSGPTPSLSRDGRYVVFSSQARNLVTGDSNLSSDMFVHDVQVRETTLVSVASDGTQGNAWSGETGCDISGDGRYVVFTSAASNLVPDDTNGLVDVFRHDRQTGETTRVSVASDGFQAMGGASGNPRISSNGRYVTFMSYATNLVLRDTNDSQDIFRHDCLTGETIRVNVANDGSQMPYGEARSPDISDDGRYVAFSSNSSHLVDGYGGGFHHVFVRDCLLNTTSVASVDDSGVQGDDDSNYPAISSDGRYIAFGSHATNLVTGDTNGQYDVFLHSIAGYTLTLGTSGEGDIAVAGATVSPPWSGFFSVGTAVDVEALAAPGWSFAGWSGDLDGSANPLSLYIDSDRSIVAEFSLVFSDIDSACWAVDEIMACVYASVVAGYDDGAYHPEWPVARDQMAAYVSRGLAGGDDGVPDFIGTPGFPDVDADHWALDYVEYAVESNVVTGYDDGYYHPEYQVTRDQMAVYVARALVAPTGEAALADYSPAYPRNFPDVPSTGCGDDGTEPFWAYRHIEYCVEHGVVQGYGDGYYHPEYTVTRDQMAVYVARAFDLM